MLIPSIEVDESNISEVSKKLELLSNSLHLHILLVLTENKKSSKELYLILKEKKLIKYLGSTYKALEKLKDLKIIKKEYDDKKKNFVYFI